jgi:hypothetical protein
VPNPDLGMPCSVNQQPAALVDRSARYIFRIELSSTSSIRSMYRAELEVLHLHDDHAAGKVECCMLHLSQTGI